MRIGPYQLKNNLIVAPMAGVTDRPFRMLCKRMGAGMAVSEMVSSNSLLYGSEKTKRRANHEGEGGPVSGRRVGGGGEGGERVVFFKCLVVREEKNQPPPQP